MIIDVIGIELTPGNNGKDSLGNGEHFTQKGERIECCCDECDYLLCCVTPDNVYKCKSCNEIHCPRSQK